MALPTITRGILFREDWLTSAGVTPWTLDSGVTLISDGDIATIAVTTATNGATANTGLVGTTGASNAASKLLVRAKMSGLIFNTFDIKITYGDSTTQTVTFNPGSRTDFVSQSFALTSGKDLAGSTVKILNAANSVSITMDFLIFYKELLTLPTVLQPVMFRKQRTIVEIPILQREGGQVQDLGSTSPEVTVSGGLVSTTSGQQGWTNTWTADQWWQILYGLTIEAGTLQSDGNPSWQWFQSDQIQGKMLVRGVSLAQPPGRLQYWNYTMSLKQFDVNAESTNDLVGFSY